MNEEPNTEEDFVASIAPYVTGVLTANRFFAMLDDMLSPDDDSKATVRCVGDYANSKRILTELGFDATAIDDVFRVLRSRGGFCDCEILCNAVETPRLKATYWRAQAERHDLERRRE